MTRKPHSGKLRLCKASSTRGDQDQQASVLEELLRRGSTTGRLGQTIQGCHVAPRMPRRPKQPSSPLLVRGAGVAALFHGVPSGPAFQLPRDERESSGPSHHFGGTQRSSVEDQGAIGARPGWRAQLGAQARCCRASRHLLAGVHEFVSGGPAFSRPAGSARDSSCSQSQANLPTSRPRIVRCACWTQRARFSRESYATGWRLSQRDPEASRSDSMASGKGDQ
ncbi:unnamed protein product [Trichogramma brassicae]|uniref:Uncharacterized protein n=1 Tax=Trichogramma brassicae TaxID=86971 RepID=A0A6H5HUG4_9HYME|nr:unnamed protein product [Trichogramma brassicae]